MEETKIEPLSATSLYLETYYDQLCLGSGTGFVAKRNDKYFLITNRHVVTGRHQETGKPLHEQGAIPNKMKVHFNLNGILGEYFLFDYQLQDLDGNNLWYEHPILTTKADFVALLLPRNEKISLSYYYEIDNRRSRYYFKTFKHC